MARKKTSAHSNHERWLISYADFITLLFAFFVVMFASSNIDKARAQRVAESVRKALEGDHATQKLAAILGGTVNDTGKGNALARGPGGAQKTTAVSVPKPQAPAELLPSLEFLTKELGEEIRAGKIKVRLEPRGLVVSLPQATYFPSGQDAVDPATFPTLEKVARVILGLPNPIRLEGHTDAVPIHNLRFRSNWELSAARSIAVLELLVNRFRIARTRMAIAGYADNVPVGPNETEEGRARNRRVDLVVLSVIGMLPEPFPLQQNAVADAAPAN